MEKLTSPQILQNINKIYAYSQKVYTLEDHPSFQKQSFLFWAFRRPLTTLLPDEMPDM